MGQVVNLNELIKIRQKAKRENKEVVFTNGCFDILHRGHVEFLRRAKKLGDILVVGLNSDASVKKIKGRKRPIVNQGDRALILSNLLPVDYVCLFGEETPYNLISALLPDVLVKGADYRKKDVVGRDIVESSGGKVVNLRLVKGKSTKTIIRTILGRYR